MNLLLWLYIWFMNCRHNCFFFLSSICQVKFLIKNFICIDRILSNFWSYKYNLKKDILVTINKNDKDWGYNMHGKLHNSFSIGSESVTLTSPSCFDRPRPIRRLLWNFLCYRLPSMMLLHLKILNDVDIYISFKFTRVLLIQRSPMLK